MIFASFAAATVARAHQAPPWRAGLTVQTQCQFWLAAKRPTLLDRLHGARLKEYVETPDPQSLSSEGRNAYTFSTSAPSPDQFVVTLNSRGTFSYDPPYGEIAGEKFELTVARVDAYDPIGRWLSIARTSGPNVGRVVITVHRDGRVITRIPGLSADDYEDTTDRNIELTLPYVMFVSRYDRRAVRLNVDLRLSLDREHALTNHHRIPEVGARAWTDFGR